MQISFIFNFDKAVEAMAYLVDRLGPMDKVKLMKLMYIADRNHFVQRGYPITGSTQVAMDHGPLPSSCLTVLDGEYWADPSAPFEFLHIDNYTVSLRKKPTAAKLDDAERRTLDGVIGQFGPAQTWDLVEHTHRFPEYREVYVKGTSTPIPYELMLKTYLGEDGLRHNRPVIGEETARRRIYQFTAPNDADL